MKRVRIDVTFALPKGGIRVIDFVCPRSICHEHQMLVQKAIKLAPEEVANVLRIEVDGVCTYDYVEDHQSL